MYLIIVYKALTEASIPMKKVIRMLCNLCVLKVKNIHQIKKYILNIFKLFRYKDVFKATSFVIKICNICYIDIKMVFNCEKRTTVLSYQNTIKMIIFLYFNKIFYKD